MRRTPKWIDRSPEVRKLSRVEAAWLAAAIDGEGSFGLYDYGREGRRVQIQLGNTSEAFVRRFRELIGCGSTVFRAAFAASHKGRKPMYHYSLKGSARCYAVLRQVTPFLIIKRSNAERIMDELESKPFGRWANATLEGRQKASLSAKASWVDPVVRARRTRSIQLAVAKRFPK